MVLPVGEAPFEAGEGAVGDIDAVVAGNDVDVAAFDVYGDAFHAFVRFKDVDGAVGDGHGVVGVDAVAAGGKGEAATGNVHVPVGMNGVVAAVQVKGAAGDGHLRAGFQAFGAGVFVDGAVAAAGGDDGIAPAVNGQDGLRLNAVFGGSQVEGAIGKEDEA